MGRKRRQVGLDDPTRWVFNRMADVYDARPAYPAALLDALVALAPGSRVLDLGAGTGKLALPLAARGGRAQGAGQRGQRLRPALHLRLQRAGRPARIFGHV